MYARFLAKDHDSGRVSYFVSRRTWLKVTELVLSLMRVSDPRIASLRDRVLQGRSPGRTEVQVLSPITGMVYLIVYYLFHLQLAATYGCCPVLFFFFSLY